MATLLIVDDEPNLLTALELALDMEGFDVRTASNGPDALLRLEGVDLVLTDLSMPGFDGFTLLREIKLRNPSIPVAIMTAHGKVELALKAMQEGAYDYLLKPCNVDEIVLKIRLGLQLTRYEHELRKQNEELERTKSRLEGLNDQLFNANAQLKAANERLERQATTDSLTGLPNRRKFMERLRLEAANTRRYRTKFSLAMIDVDHFKRVNDTFGHPVGDRVLQEIATDLMGRARETDLPARIGGEEFAIILPSTEIDGAREFADDLRRRVELRDFGEVGPVTISIGIAMYEHIESGLEQDLYGERLLALADRALYRAKAFGRNRVEES